MSGRTVFDVSQAIERQKLGRFLVGLVVISWIITFFDGFDPQAIAFAAPTIDAVSPDRIMMGNIFTMGLVGTLIGGFRSAVSATAWAAALRSSRRRRVRADHAGLCPRRGYARFWRCVSSSGSRWAECCRSPGH